MSESSAGAVAVALAALLVLAVPPVVLDYTVGQAWSAVVGYAALVPVDIDPPGFGEPTTGASPVRP